MEYSLIDIILLIIIIASAVYGLFKGFVSQIVSIGSLVVGVWCAFKFSNLLTGYAKELVPNNTAESTLHILVFIAILIIAIILGHFLGKGIEKIIKISMLDWLNRILGFIFAAFKTTLILSVGAYVLDYVKKIWEFIPDDLFTSSAMYNYLLKFSNVVFPYLQDILK